MAVPGCNQPYSTSSGVETKCVRTEYLRPPKLAVTVRVLHTCVRVISAWLSQLKNVKARKGIVWQWLIL